MLRVSTKKKAKICQNVQIWRKTRWGYSQKYRWVFGFGQNEQKKLKTGN